jgi:hypothetical protein
MPKYKYSEATRKAFKLSAMRTGGKHPMVPSYYNIKYGKKKRK